MSYVICKKKYRGDSGENYIWFEKDRKCRFEIISPNIIRVYNGAGDSSRGNYFKDFIINNINNRPGPHLTNFHEYFYTQKYYRKIKLNRLKEHIEK